MTHSVSHCDIAVIGAGAAGLMAAIWAARTIGEATPHRNVIVLDGAKRLGSKILVAGGGRCNVTHDVVDETAYAGSSRNAIKKVLRQFGVERTVQFFRELGVELKREETGKLFPVSDDAHTVLDALLRATGTAHVEIVNPWRVEIVEREEDGFAVRRVTEKVGERWSSVQGEDVEEEALTLPSPARAGEGANEVRARRVVLATGGRSLPKTGSDGHGYAIARSLGHSITPRMFPGLVPLTMPKDHFICSLSGLTVPATIELRAASGKRLISFTDSTLCTHFGLSGPGVLDVSRYWTDAMAEWREAGSIAGANPRLVLNWLAGTRSEELDKLLVAARGVGIARWLSESSPLGARVVGHGERGMPERLARMLCERAGVEPGAATNLLTREQRRAVVTMVTEMELPITGDRGYLHAEVTAGGVPLSEIHLETMESRVCPGLHLCGEICDVDGRIGGYNFQWAWASGFVAGSAAGAGAVAEGKLI